MNSLQTIVLEMGGVLQEMAPYLLLGFLIAGLLSVFLSPRLVRRHLGGRGALPVIKASLFGVPMPLCSCGVIPVTAGLKKHGAGPGASTSFLLSTPQTGVDSILVTYSLLGGVFTLFRIAMAFLIGFVCGWLVDLFAPDEAGRGSGVEVAEEDGEGGEGSPDPLSQRLLTGLRFGFVVLPRDIGLHLLVGIVITGLLGALLTPGALTEWLAPGPLAILAMMALGIPLYVCSTASVPIAYALLALGASPGAALAFLITGPATNAATVTTVWTMMGRRTTFIYLAGVALCAFGAGMLLDALPVTTAITEHIHAHEMAGGWLGQVSAIALLLLLAPSVGAAWRKRAGKRS